MAEHVSARPTGESAPWARSGYALGLLQQAITRVSKDTIGAVLGGAAALHILHTVLRSGDLTNPMWPVLMVVYGVVIATWSIFTSPWIVSTHQSITRQTTNTFAQTKKSSSGDQGLNDPELAALRHAARQRHLAVSNLSPQPTCFSTSPAWTDLMSQVSHELRTPLNAVIGFSDVMNAELLGPLNNPRYREYMAHIRDSSRELLKSAEDTLAMTSLLVKRHSSEHHMKSINVHTMALEAWNFVSAEAHLHGITLDLVCAEELSIVAEVRPLRQTFINLFSEALKRSSDNSQIVLSAFQEGELLEIEVRTACCQQCQQDTTPSLAIAIARALLELQGTTLVIIHTPDGAWSAITVFDCPMQSDFFESAPTATHTQVLEIAPC